MPDSYKLEWDGTGQKRYEMGVDHGVLFPMKEGEYQTGVAWNGLSNVTDSPEGAEPNDIYADNIKYASIRSAESLNGTIEAYMYPDEFAECDGSVTPKPGLHIRQQSRKPFGFSYRTKVGDDTDQNLGYIIHLVYNATVSPSEITHETINDSPEPSSMSWEYTTVPVPVGEPNGYEGDAIAPTAKLEFDSTKLPKDKMAELEKILYGDGLSTPSKLPTPKEAIEIFTKEAV